MFIASEVVLDCSFSGDLFEGIAGGVSCGSEIEFANSSESVRPVSLEGFRGVSEESLVVLPEVLIFEGVVEDAEMVVRAFIIVPIFAAVEITDSMIWICSA